MKADNDRVVVQIPSTPEFIQLVRFVIAGVANVLQFDLEEIADLKLAVGEGCYQILQSALFSCTVLTLEAKPKDDGLEISLVCGNEQGEGGGDWWGRLPERELLNPSLGLTLLHKVVDKVCFTADSESTSLVLYKRRRGDSASSRNVGPVK